MKYEEMSTQKVVEYINAELLKNRTMKEIEEKDFEVNKGVIQKRLNRKGYVKVNNQFVSAKDKTTANTTNTIQNIKDNTEKATEILHQKENITTNKDTKIIQNKSNEKSVNKPFSDDEINKINKLLKLDLDVLDKIIKEYNTKNDTDCSLKVKSNETTVTSIRLNKELYKKIKAYSKKENIKLQDIFKEMMIQYINTNIK